MTQEEADELEKLKERFPTIQEIHADSMDMAGFSGLLLVVALGLIFLGHPWWWLEGVARVVSAVLFSIWSVSVYKKAAEEDSAIQRYFHLLDKNRRGW